MGSQRNREIHKIEKQENGEIFLVSLQRMKMFVNQTPVWLTTPNVGLEPTTLRLRVSCSTDWASRAFITRACISWNRSQQYLLEFSKNFLKEIEKLGLVWGSNSGPLDYETNALPIALTWQQRSESRHIRYLMSGNSCNICQSRQWKGFLEENFQGKSFHICYIFLCKFYK